MVQYVLMLLTLLSYTILSLKHSASLSQCSTQGPNALQYNTARHGGIVLTVAYNLSISECAHRCCMTTNSPSGIPCRSWMVMNNNSKIECHLFGEYSSPLVSSGTTSGVVYRTNIQPEKWASIRGFNYLPPFAINDIDMWRDYNQSVVERDMTIAQKAGFNFCRVFLNYVVWKAQGDTFLKNLRHFVSTAHAHGINTMPIPFDLCWFGCRNEEITINVTGKCWYASPEYKHADNRTWWKQSYAYIDALVGTKGLPAGTPGLLLWDVVNEPESGGQSHLPGEKGVRWQFVKNMVSYFRNVTSTPTTVGVASVDSLAQIGDFVDVITFHSYHHTWEQGLRNTELALQYSRKLNKGVFNSETGCIARANSYDQTIEMAIRNGIGFAVWELMISDCMDCVDTRRWKHGLMYSDGTTRDPTAIAAIRGVYINRGDVVKLAVPRPDVEGQSTSTANAIKNWLVHNDSADYLTGIDLLDTLANIAESSLTIPDVLPISHITRRLAAAGDTPDTRAILTKELANDYGPLIATKMGKETGTGVCTFDGTHNPCTSSEACTPYINTDYMHFNYNPPTTTTLRSCWTVVGNCPTDEGDGFLHYCQKTNATLTFTLKTKYTKNIHYKSSNMYSKVELEYKAGPDCGMIDIILDGDIVFSSFDTYNSVVIWDASLSIVQDLDASVDHTFVIRVLGKHRAEASDSWIQIVAINVWK